MAHDPDTDTVYVTAAYRKREATPLTHCETLRPWDSWLPWAWPHDGLQHDKQSGVQLAEAYRRHGLNMLAERPSFSDGSYGFEAGITQMLTRMEQDTLKVFSHLHDWLEEFATYHRKDGVVVKLHDDLLSATRVALMELRAACTKPRLRPRRERSVWAN